MGKGSGGYNGFSFLLSFLPNEENHSLLPPNSPYYYDVDTWCPFKRQIVILTLASDKEFKGNVVRGKPVKCSLDNCDGRLKHPHCYLNAIQIETRKLHR